MDYVNKIAQLIIPDSILVIDSDGNSVTEKSDKKTVDGLIEQIKESQSQENESNSVVFKKSENRTIDEIKKKRRFESMMEVSEDEDTIEEIIDSNQNFINHYARELKYFSEPDSVVCWVLLKSCLAEINIEIDIGKKPPTYDTEDSEYTEEWSTEAVVNEPI